MAPCFVREVPVTHRCGRPAAVVVLISTVLLGGCEPMAITAFGVSASTGVAHTLNGITYRTFTAPSPTVKKATLAALNRMGIKVVSTQKIEGGERINAKTADREIEADLESISANTTRLRVIARQGSLFYDSATATEIILQTERSIGGA